MNVLLASSKYMPEYAGSGFRAHNLYRRLSRSHPEISYSVFCGSETANQSAVYEYDGVQVNRIAGKSYETLSQGIIRNYQIFRNFQAENSKTKQALAELPKTPDLIHVFGKNYVTASILDYAYREKIPVLIELCNEMDSPFQYIPFPNRLWVNDQLPDKYRLSASRKSFGKSAWPTGFRMTISGAGPTRWMRPSSIRLIKSRKCSYELN